MSGKNNLESDSPEKSMFFCEALVICSSTRYSNPKMMNILFWKKLSTVENVEIFESKIDDFLEDHKVRIEMIWKIGCGVHLILGNVTLCSHKYVQCHTGKNTAQIKSSTFG